MSCHVFVVNSRRTAAWTSSNAFGRTHRNLSLREKPQGARSEHVQDFQRLKWQRNATKVFGQNKEVATDSWWKVKTPFWDILRPTHSLLVLFFRFILPLRFIRRKHPIQFIAASCKCWLRSTGSAAPRATGKSVQSLFWDVIRCVLSYNLRNECQVLENCVQIPRSPFSAVPGPNPPDGHLKQARL